MSDDSFTEFLDHPADIQIHCKAPTLARLFEQCATTMIGYAVNPQARTGKTEQIELCEDDIKILFVNLLNHFLDLLYCESKVAINIRVQITCTGLKCDYDVLENLFAHKCEIKAVTFCGLKIYEYNGCYHLYCIFDV